MYLSRPCGPQAAWPFFLPTVLLLALGLLTALGPAPVHAEAVGAETSITNSPTPTIANTPSSLDKYIALALEKGMDKGKPWLALLHMKPTLLGGQESLIDDPKYFLAKGGKSDPTAELAATLRAFFEPGPSDDGHARCKFPARFRLLNQELGFASELGPMHCTAFVKYIDTMKPRSATVVFPESHINSPASMFGHTLIRVDSAAENKLMSQAVSYAAVTGESFGPLFAIRGIFGLYPGYFTVHSYYERITDYSLIENRDIWEYDLTLTPEEVRYMAEHVWEMKDIFSKYYFFDENCSYILLFLIEAARPSINITEDFFYWIIPADTVRVLYKHRLIKNSLYRPARSTRINYIAGQTSLEHQETARAIALGEKTPESIANTPGASREEQIRTLDLASEYLQFSAVKSDMDKAVYNKRLLGILGPRSTLGKIDYNIPSPIPPEQGHLSARVGLGVGARDGEGYGSLVFRTAYHDMLDPDEGYKEGAAISFMDLKLKGWFDGREDGDVTLDHFNFVEIVSAYPTGVFFRPISWRVNVGFMAEEDRYGQERTPFVLSPAGGISKRLGEGLGYIYLGPEIKIGGAMQEGYALGGSLALGYLFKPTDWWKGRVEAKTLGYGVGHRHDQHYFSQENNFKLTTNNSIRLGYTYSISEGHGDSDVSLQWNMFF